MTAGGPEFAEIGHGQCGVLKLVNVTWKRTSRILAESVANENKV